ncbi:MAG: ATP-dependent RecD-like DNA helicase [Deltaproteobacteria bacterium]|nr:ATP-dependent RecD-like DNA helicase [Deltaproteobacteria bacterium]
MEEPAAQFPPNHLLAPSGFSHSQHDALPQHEVQVKLQITRTTYRDENNGWSVLQCQGEKGNAVTVTGYLGDTHPGETIMAFGKWGDHPKFGKRLVVSRAVSVLPSDEDALIHYLSCGLFKGIGQKTAERVVKHLGMDLVSILNETPQKLKTVPKLGKRTANKLIHAWAEKKKHSEAMMFLINHGITYRSAQKMIANFGNDTVDVISANPYCLIRQIKGFGFVRADQIARELGIAKDAPQRIEHGIIFLLQQAEDFGHCFQTKHQLIQNLAGQLEIDDHEKIDEALDFLLRQDLLITDHDQEELFTRELFLAEKEAASYLSQIASAPFQGHNPKEPDVRQRITAWLHRFCEKSQIELSPSQQNAVLNAVSSKVFILTGGPGVGKTTTANAIIHLLRAMGRDILLAAPTGRAAQRLSEVSSMKAKTIHRLLEWSPLPPTGFQKNETNPLTAQVIIVDEASMLDVRLANSLLRAVRDRSQLIFIGDQDQLPPVGPGNVLKDMIHSERIPFTKLTEIFRQAAGSQIIQTAHRINNGAPCSFSNEAQSDCHFIKTASDEETLATLEELLGTSLPHAGYNPKTDVQILSPMNKGPLGCGKLNELFQNLLNPPKGDGESQGNKSEFRRDDKVIQTVNNYELFVFNGDIGYVEHNNVEGGKLIVRFGKRLVTYNSEQRGDLKLAYAITIHKSQGSEFPVVVIPLSLSHFVMLERNLVYTALTRARKLAIFVGSYKAFALAVQNQRSHQRQTKLRELLVTS